MFKKAEYPFCELIFSWKSLFTQTLPFEYDFFGTGHNEIHFYYLCEFSSMWALADFNYLIFWKCSKYVWSTGKQEILPKNIVETTKYLKPFRYSAPLRRKQWQCPVGIRNGELCSPQGKLLFHLSSWNNQIRKVLHLRDWKLRRVASPWINLKTLPHKISSNFSLDTVCFKHFQTFSNQLWIFLMIILFSKFWIPCV